MVSPQLQDCKEINLLIPQIFSPEIRLPSAFMATAHHDVYTFSLQSHLSFLVFTHFKAFDVGFPYV